MNEAEWWIDFTIDRLISERWRISIQDWPMGVFVQALLVSEMDTAGTMYENIQICYDVALVSKDLSINLERELQLVQCGSILVGCFDNLDPYVLW